MLSSGKGIGVKVWGLGFWSQSSRPRVLESRFRDLEGFGVKV